MAAISGLFCLYLEAIVIASAWASVALRYWVGLAFTVGLGLVLPIFGGVTYRRRMRAGTSGIRLLRTIAVRLLVAGFLLAVVLLFLSAPI